MDTTVGGSGTPSKKRRTALIVGIVVVIVVIAAVAVTLAYLPHKPTPSASKVTITVWDTIMKFPTLNVCLIRPAK